LRHERGEFETHAHPASPYFMRVSGLAKNPILSKTVQDCLRTEAAAACLDDGGLASKIEREARNLPDFYTLRGRGREREGVEPMTHRGSNPGRSFILYEAEGTQTKGG